MRFWNALLLCLIVTSSSRAQFCDPYWRGGPPLPGTVGGGTQFVQFDDGTGETVYVTKSLVPGVKRWAGSGWEDLPLPPLPPNFWYANLRLLNDGTGDAVYYLVRKQQTGDFQGFRWSGTGWTVMPAAFVTAERFPFASAKLNGIDRIIAKKLFAGGNDHGLFVWNGTGWDLLVSTGKYNTVAGLFNHGTDLLVVGSFPDIGGVPCNGIARFDGQQWHAVPGVHGTHAGGWSGVEFDDGTGPALYMTSIKFPPFVQYFPGVFKFDGETFTPIGFTAPSPAQGWITWVSDLAVFDDGRGPALYIAGGFPQFGMGSNIVTCNGIVRWDGKTFEPLGIGGTSSFIGEVQTSFGRALLAGKDESTVHGGGNVNGSALWVTCPHCYANCDLSENAPKLNVADFGCFLSKFATKDPYANCTVDAAIDVADFQCFLQKFAAGCP